MILILFLVIWINGSLEIYLLHICVAEIRDNATLAWVLSDENIAELGSRWTTPDKVKGGSKWQNGPSCWKNLWLAVQLKSIPMIFLVKFVLYRVQKIPSSLINSFTNCISLHPSASHLLDQRGMETLERLIDWNKNSK